MQSLRIELARNAPDAPSDARLRKPPDEELRQMVETADTGLTRCSKDLRYLAANPAYARIAGLAVELIVGRPIADVMGTAALETIRPYLERVLRGERVEYEAEMTFGSSAPRYLHVVYTPWRLHSGEIAGWVASVSDITESRRAQELQQEVLTIAMLEQGRIGQELHDGIQQELIGLGLLAESLRDMIGGQGVTGRVVELANRVTEGVAKANAHVRKLAHGLIPMAVDIVSGSAHARCRALRGHAARGGCLNRGTSLVPARKTVKIFWVHLCSYARGSSHGSMTSSAEGVRRNSGLSCLAGCASAASVHIRLARVPRWRL